MDAMIDSNGFNVTIQHEATIEDIFDNLLDQIDAPPEFLAAIDDVVIGETK
jgi:hypothetical protein